MPLGLRLFEDLVLCTLLFLLVSTRLVFAARIFLFSKYIIVMYFMLMPSELIVSLIHLIEFQVNSSRFSLRRLFSPRLCLPPYLSLIKVTSTFDANLFIPPSTFTSKFINSFIFLYLLTV